MVSTALYYPNVEPPSDWLRGAALFFDRITSFVPRESEEHLSDGLKSFAEVTGAWQAYTPVSATASVVDVPAEDMQRTFAAIRRAEGITDKVSLKMTFRTDGAVEVANHVFMHGYKLSPEVRACLEVNGLILPQELVQPLMSGDWWLVNEKASDVILAAISDRIAQRERWSTITDINTCFSFASTSVRSEASAEDLLAKVLVVELVPAWIEALSLKQYAELRKRYEPIREKFSSFMSDLVVQNKLARIRDEESLREAVRDCARELSAEVAKLRSSEAMRQVKKWSTFSLGSLVSISGVFLGGAWSLPLAGAGVLISAADKAGVLEEKGSARTDMLRLLARAESDAVKLSGAR